MNVLVICRPAPGFGDSARALIPDETLALKRLRDAGLLVHAWSPGGPGAVLMFEADLDHVRAELDQLPLVTAHLITTEVIPLTPMQLGD